MMQSPFLIIILCIIVIKHNYCHTNLLLSY